MDLAQGILRTQKEKRSIYTEQLFDLMYKYPSIHLSVNTFLLSSTGRKYFAPFCDN